MEAPPPPPRPPRPATEPRATVVAPAAPPETPAGRGARAKAPSAAKVETARRRTKAPWWLRIAAWVVAVPVGLVLVGIPARKLGYLDSQKLLDVVIGKDTGRYLPLAVIVVLWALVTAILVQLIVEGGGWLLRRRQARRGTATAA